MRAFHCPGRLSSRRLLVLSFAALAVACRFDTNVPTDSGTHHVERSPLHTTEAPATLWVSYQLHVVAIDGRERELSAERSGVYYRLSLDPGEHTLTVRLDYRSPTQQVVSEPVELSLDLREGAAYRLLDLGTGRADERRFVPRVVEGAPE